MQWSQFNDMAKCWTYPKAQAVILASWNWSADRKDMEVYGSSGYVKALNQTAFSYRLTREKPEVQENLSPLPATQSEPFGYFANVIKGKIKIAPTDLSSLENNLIVVKILDAARKSAETKSTVMLDMHPSQAIKPSLGTGKEITSY